jgi:hypothetical protein
MTRRHVKDLVPDGLIRLLGQIQEKPHKMRVKPIKLPKMASRRNLRRAF